MIVLTIHPNSRAIIRDLMIENHGEDPFDITDIQIRKLRNPLASHLVIETFPEHIKVVRM